jgi:hypothetical protein
MNGDIFELLLCTFWVILDYMGRLHTRGSRFLNYNFLQCAVDGKNNSKTKVEKAFFFIFMSSYAEMSFLKQKITKLGQKNFFGEVGRYGVQKIRNFTLISNWGFLSLYLAPFKS